MSNVIVLRLLWYLLVLESIEPVDCVDGTIRLIRESAYSGLLEICQNHVWGTVCSDNGFSHQDANSICQILGYQPFGKIYVVVLIIILYIVNFYDNVIHREQYFLYEDSKEQSSNV